MHIENVDDFNNNDNDEDKITKNSNNNIQMNPLVLSPYLTLDYTKLRVVQLEEYFKCGHCWLLWIQSQTKRGRCNGGGRKIRAVACFSEGWNICI